MYRHIVVEVDMAGTYYVYVLFDKKPGEVTCVGPSIDGSWCM